ncbi:MAG: hypothetical protein LIO86_01475 [Lachnospiraceae bacterium]|nr:hypothetical protein [Lachnospiraceae bacterium]
MSSGYQKKVEEYTTQLNNDETVEMIAYFNTIPRIIMFLGVALCMFIVGRLFQQNLAVLLFTNVLSMWMMVDAAHTVFVAQNSCVIVTNQRTFGQSGERRINIRHTDLKNVAISQQILYLEEEGQRCIAVRYVSNRSDLYSAIIKHCPHIR